MSEEIQLLVGERYDNETKKAVLGCNDYLRIGGGRSLKKQLAYYTEDVPGRVQEPPTKSLRTLKGWSVKFGWVERANLYDIAQEGLKDELIKERMEEGLSLDHQRVEELKGLYEIIKTALVKEAQDGTLIIDGLWVEVNKQFGTDYKYNSALIDNLRGLLDDLAKETGGRVKKMDVNTNQEIIMRISGIDEGDV